MHDLTRQIGDRRARQLLLSGDLISATTAHDWGLVNTVTPNERCLERGHPRARKTWPNAPRWHWRRPRGCSMKRSAGRATCEAPPPSAPPIRCSEEAKEGIRAFVEKRRPDWAWFHTEGAIPMTNDSAVAPVPGSGTRRLAALWTGRPPDFPITTRWCFPRSSSAGRGAS